MHSFTNFRFSDGLRRRYQVILIVAVLLAIYYPVVFAETTSIDDREMIKSLEEMKSWNLKTLFIPGMQGAVYYRPFLSLSFLFDKYVLNLDTNLMHLTNIGLHILNAILVFWLTCQLLPRNKQEQGFIPLIAALLFGLHPVTTESVCWISGRTDILAGNFILLSANHIMLAKSTRSFRYLFFASLFMIFGFLAKEVSLAFLPGAFLLYFWSDNSPSTSLADKKRHSLGPLGQYQPYLMLLLGACAFLSFFLLRNAAVVSNESRIASSLKFIFMDVTHSTFVILKSLAFYAKKLYFPLPLNFTIIEVDPLYELLAVPVIVGCFILISKKTQLSAVFLAGIFLIFPSFAIAFGQIAWTSYAERYLYLSAAFVVTATSLFASGEIGDTGMLRRVSVLALLLMMIMSAATFHRNLVWKSNLSILEDSVIKNPQFYFIRGQYAGALAENGDFKNARLHYMVANEYNKKKKALKSGHALFQLKYWDLPEAGLAYLLMKENRLQEAATAYENIFAASRGDSKSVLANIVLLYGSMLYNEKNEANAKNLKKKLSFYSQKLYSQSANPQLIYWLGKVFLKRGDRHEAASCFMKARDMFSQDDPYKFFSEKLVIALEDK